MWTTSIVNEVLGIGVQLHILVALELISLHCSGVTGGSVNRWVGWSLCLLWVWLLVCFGVLCWGVFMCGYFYYCSIGRVCMVLYWGFQAAQGGAITMGFLLLSVGLVVLLYSPCRGRVNRFVFAPGRLSGGGFAHGRVGGAGTVQGLSRGSVGRALGSFW